uniref:Anillin n=1 Tax=Poecilia mexicana TaxID=48701 RepID=A0A3B3WC76_9TELE
MDPFTEKLLERTRARRENLQRKLAERPNAANRQMVKRPREPLTESNNTITDSNISSKPSPSKRRCSEENQLARDEENQVPVMTQAGGPVPPDPLTDKKPPVGPASIRSSSSLEQSSTRPVQSQLKELKAERPENMAVTPGPVPPSTREAPTEPPGFAQHRNKPDQVDDSTPSAAGMKSRLQRLAQQRKCWDGDDGKHSSDTVPDSTPPTLSKRPVEVQPPASLPPSEAPAGRRGRLANLAATIGSWEDDLSHAHIPKGNPGSGSVPRPAVRVAAAGSKQTADTSQSPVKSSQMILPSPQKAEISASKTAIQTVQSPLKNPKQEAALPPSPHMATSSEATSAPKSPLKTQLFPRTPGYTASPLRPALQDRATMSTSLGHQEPVSVGGPGESNSSRISVSKRCISIQTGVKSFLERFGERCQQHKEQGAPPRAPTPARSAPSTASVTPNTKLVQERLRAAQAAHTATAELTQRQKMLELFWHVIGFSFVSTSSPMRGVSQPGEKPSKEEEVVVKEKEMNVDHSINSAVINELFDGVLEQSEDQEDEEEDALNISSMSLLTPLAETVAAVVKSPDRRLVTSTPASSFLVKSNTPESSCSPGKFQRTTVARSDSSDEDHRLPYSIDAYRSIRVKEPERPAVKQVIVRREDVSKRVEEPRAASLFSMKQRMKMLTSEVNLQQTVIHQASQALNCCTDEEHGKGSQVEAEAERLLLLATEKREALKAELDCLKGEPAGQKKTCHPEPAAISASKGSIILQELRLPLKADFVCSTANKPDSTKHSFFIMIRAGAENMVATPLASTHRGLSGDTLTFPTKFTLSDVSSDFKIDLEVYCLVCVILLLVKLPYSILVPNGLAMVSFRYKNVSSVPFLCPLEGHIHLQLQCEVGCSTVEERGFLTMFEDVSGFGAWHRRWCVLSGYCISYWTYPDDEKRKNPIGRINLANCTSEKVEPANREFCARPNTFELITVRPQREDDKETLVSQCMDTMCVTKNWLSADTKDERNLWMKKLNQILVDLRMWQPAACYKPL